MSLKSQISSLSLTMALAAGGTCASAAQMPYPPPLDLSPQNSSVDVVVSPDKPGTFNLVSNFYGVRSTRTQECSKLEGFRDAMLDPRISTSLKTLAEEDAREELTDVLRGRIPTLLQGDPDKAVRVYAEKAIQATLKAHDLCFPLK